MPPHICQQTNCEIHLDIIYCFVFFFAVHYGLTIGRSFGPWACEEHLTLLLWQQYFLCPHRIVGGHPRSLFLRIIYPYQKCNARWGISLCMNYYSQIHTRRKKSGNDICLEAVLFTYNQQVFGFLPQKEHICEYK